MQIYDIVMIVILLGATAFGFVKGLAWQVASLASLVVSYLAAAAFSGTVAPMFGGEGPWSRVVAMLVIFVVVGAAIWFLFRLVAALIDRIKLQEFDRQLGAIVGAVKGGLLCLAVTFFLVTLSESARESILHTKTGYWAAWAMDQGHALMPTEVHDHLEPYIHSLDDALPDGSHHHPEDERLATDPDRNPQAQYGGSGETLSGLVEETLVERFGAGDSARR